MHIKFTLPWGGEFEYHWEPMDGDKFLDVCVMIGLAMVFTAIIVAILH